MAQSEIILASQKGIEAMKAVIPKFQFDLFNQPEENHSGNYILCEDCKNYQRCKSFWRGSVNSINCEIRYGLFESIAESEGENE